MTQLRDDGRLKTQSGRCLTSCVERQNSQHFWPSRSGLWGKGVGIPGQLWDFWAGCWDCVVILRIREYTTWNHRLGEGSIWDLWIGECKKQEFGKVVHGGESRRPGWNQEKHTIPILLCPQSTICFLKSKPLKYNILSERYKILRIQFNTFSQSEHSHITTIQIKKQNVTRISAMHLLAKAFTATIMLIA